MQEWRRGAAVLAVALTLGVAACDPGEDPTNPPPSQSSEESSTASESPSGEAATETTTTAGPPELDPPEPPDGMFVDDHQGVALAAGYFLELYNYMRATGDTNYFESMSGPDCNFCAYSVETVNAVYGNGEWLEGGAIEFDISDANVVLATSEQSAYTVQLDATQTEMLVHRSDGSVDEVASDELQLGMGLEFVNERFIVVGVNVE